jgi:hypothetical protein
MGASELIISGPLTTISPCVCKSKVEDDVSVIPAVTPVGQPLVMPPVGLLPAHTKPFGSLIPFQGQSTRSSLREGERQACSLSISVAASQADGSMSPAVIGTK